MMETKQTYQLLKNEIKRHTEDSESAVSTQFSASNRNDKLHNRFLKIGFFLTLVGVSYIIRELFDNTKSLSLIGQLITLAGAFCTLWPLIKDYSGRSEIHRRFAEEYNDIRKQCLNWETEFEQNGNYDIEIARRSVLEIRNMLVRVSRLSPKTNDSDYNRGKDNIDGGSYRYNTDQNQSKDVNI